jgi:hypothetical protein
VLKQFIVLTLPERTYLIQSYGTDNLCYPEMINKFNKKDPETTISHVAVRKLVRKFVETDSVLNVYIIIKNKKTFRRKGFSFSLS